MEYLEELYEGIKEKFDNAKTLEELEDIWNNEVERISEKDRIDDEINELANHYEKVLERVLNGETGLQNEAKTEDARNRQNTSGNDVRAEEGSNGNSVRDLGSKSEISEDEITPVKTDENEQTKLYQEMEGIDKTGTPYDKETININGVEKPTTNSEGKAIVSRVQFFAPNNQITYFVFLFDLDFVSIWG